MPHSNGNVRWQQLHVVHKLSTFACRLSSTFYPATVFPCIFERHLHPVLLFIFNSLNMCFDVSCPSAEANHMDDDSVVRAVFVTESSLQLRISDRSSIMLQILPFNVSNGVTTNPEIIKSHVKCILVLWRRVPLHMLASFKPQNLHAFVLLLRHILQESFQVFQIFHA
ncbi:hypothetical protein Mapa_011121 [Marchantia paleacea]|nr:hypothetical protein Mapa_011121 [Marchantia paleacea]